MSNSSYHYNIINPSQSENRNGDVDCLVSGDAMYDYERIPAAWNGFDEQPIVYQYGDAAAWQSNSDEDAD